MLCLLVMCSMEELQELAPSSTVLGNLGNLGISWSAGVMDYVLCALNSKIMSFSRFAPQHRRRWGRDKWWEGAASCVWHQASGLAASDIILLFSLMFAFQLPPLRTSGPHTAPGRGGSASKPPRNTRGKTGPSGVSGAGRGSPTRVMGLQQS